MQMSQSGREWVRHAHGGRCRRLHMHPWGSHPTASVMPRGTAAARMGSILDELLSGGRLHIQGEEWHGKATPTQRLIQLSLLDNIKRKEVGEAAIILRW